LRNAAVSDVFIR